MSKTKYLGETTIPDSGGYDSYSKADWIALWIMMYSGIDGAHHKNWLIDQIARISKGAEVVVSVAKWDNGTTEERFNLSEPPQAYWDWVKEVKNGEDGPETYSYDFGIAP